MPIAFYYISNIMHIKDVTHWNCKHATGVNWLGPLFMV